MSRGWVGVDFDGTLAHYIRWQGPDVLGAPIPEMVERVKRWLAEGKEVRIFTARAWHPQRVEVNYEEYDSPLRDTELAINAIKKWSLNHLGQILPITCVKDLAMIELWDDRAVQVEINTGRPIGHSTRGL